MSRAVLPLTFTFTFAMTRLDSPHLRAAVLAVAMVLMLHAGLLGLWPRTPGPGSQAAKASAMQVRQIVQRPVSTPPVTNKPANKPATTPAAAPATAPATAASPAPAARVRQARAERPTPPAQAPEAEAILPVSAALAPEILSVAESTPEPGGQVVPVFATQLPPPSILHYRVQRGLVTATATLRWQWADGRYELALDTRAFNTQALGWTSRGALDAHGIAPERYVEGRRGREQRAVNFQRDAGLVTFSGPQQQYPVVPGMQDRASWMLQLSAIVAANPALGQIGSQVPMMVVSARGDAEVWVFTVVDVTELALPGGVVPAALHLKREPRRPFDVQTDVWLDPSRHHLPVRMRLMVRPTGEGTDFVLERLESP
jgi:Protein of unknown function (DUF3108)